MNECQCEIVRRVLIPHLGRKEAERTRCRDCYRRVFQRCDEALAVALKNRDAVAELQRQATQRDAEVDELEAENKELRQALSRLQKGRK